MLTMKELTLNYAEQKMRSLLHAINGKYFCCCCLLLISCSHVYLPLHGQDLSPTTFKSIVAKMCVEAGRASPPSEADLDAAFYIADLNNSGDIDMFEFVELYVAP